MTDANLRAIARSLFETAVAAADPASAVRRELTAAPLPALSEGRYILVAVGKAAAAMMTEALRHVPAAAPRTAIAVTNYENAREIPGCSVLAAGHPVPDENGLEAGKRVIRELTSAGPEDFVLCLISGGGSALLPAPLPGISLADKKKANQMLLAHGFDITEINLVRQQLSQLKGGGMARLADPARVRSLIISDVVGDDLRAIASGPTAAPLGTPADAAALLHSRGVWDLFPAAIRAHLAADDPAQKTVVQPADNRVICSNRQSLEAVARSAGDWTPQIVSARLEGDVAEAARNIVEFTTATPLQEPQLLIWGGETTVILTGKGSGGRNQELALRVALEADALPGDWVFLSGGTDGRDGPTDAAGGIVDRGTIARIRSSGLDPAALCANNDSYRALQAAGDLLVTGATGTNVADVQILIRQPSGG